MADMGWSTYIRDQERAAEQEWEARERDMLPHLAKHCDYESPHEMYRAFYKYTDCGPWVSVHVNGQWVHCQNLHKLGTWGEMMRRGDTVDEVLIGSIVEGSDVEPTPEPVRLNDLRSLRSPTGKVTLASLRKAFDRAVSRVNDEAVALYCEANAEEGEDE